MSGIGDIFSFLSPAAGMATGKGPFPQMAQVGSPLLAALLHKHGGAPAGGGGDPSAAAPAPGGPAPAPGPDLSNPGANAAAAVASLPSGGGDPAAPGGFLDGHGMDPINAALAKNSATEPTGFLDRIKKFVGSDEGRAALFRSGAETLASGNIGKGFQAGAQLVDDRRHDRDATARQGVEDAFTTRKLDQSQADINLRQQLGEAQNQTLGEHYARSDANDSDRNTIQVGELGFKRYSHDHPSGDTVAAQSGENYRTGLNVKKDIYTHDNASGDTTATQAGETFRQQHPVATPAQPHPNTLTTHVHYTTTPEEYAKNGPRLRPSQITPADSGGATKVSSDAEYAALPSGTRFVGPDGQTRVKP